MIVANTPDQIEMFRLLAMRGALKLELVGMKRRGQSVYSLIKEEFGFKGNKQKVFDQFERYIQGMRK
jgi:hypothetical protein|tara:strand:- start:2507 stop:2707 length:201 start_codon:yes stop_codon:yes gene_type:complete